MFVLMDDNFLKQINCSRKDCLTRFIEKNFRKTVDYFTILPHASHIGLYGGHNKVDYYLTKEASDLVKTSYNLRNKYITKVNDVNVKAIVAGIESSTIGFICNSLKTLPLTLHRQFSVTGLHKTVYRIDLYIPELRLAIECDEFGHRSYNTQAETRRQRFLETELKCTFLRFNPNGEGFDLSDVISEILRMFLRDARVFL